MKTTFLITTLLIFCCMAQAAKKPNMVYILADDLGWSDTTLYGTTALYQTPHLERLAKSGVTFTHAYAASPLCSPTRSSILTGLNPARIGITAPNCHTGTVQLKAGVVPKAAANVKALLCSSVTRFDTKYYTLAERLKDEGYATAHFGKWHLGPKPYSPLQHGFDVDIPHWHGPGPAGNFVAPWKFPTFKEKYPREHIEDRMGDEAVAWMEQNKDHPFFLNYWQFSVHAPFDAKAELIEKYKKTVNPDDPQRSPTYAAMVQSLDDNVGKLLDALERLDLVDNTIVIFFSDNGGNMYNTVDDTTPTSNAPLRGGKATMWEGGVRVPCVVRWPGKLTEGTKSDAVIQSTDFYPTILDMLNLESEERFDGISIVPALKGGELEREAIYTYFPHKPGVPDHLPPAVSVHAGDWKLLRLYFDNEDQTHRYLLFNLKDDIGETNDLSAKFPERVQQMDGMIEKFLVSAEAVQPLPNPNYGKSPKVPGAVFGWNPDKHCTIESGPHGLTIYSSGNDPILTYQLGATLPPDALTLNVTMSSSVGGEAQVFWAEKGVSPKFEAKRRVSFNTTASDQPQRYAVELPAQKLLSAIRFDPARAPGTIQVMEMNITDAKGKVLKTWQLNK